MIDAKQRTWPPAYFRHEDGLFVPTGLARSPWDRDAVAGGPVSGLLATCSEDPVLDADFLVARFSVDILGKVPHQPLAIRSEILRDGRQTKLHRICLDAGDRLVAQAHVLRTRKMETPVFPVPHAYPSPGSLKDTEGGNRPSMAGGIRYRAVMGDVGVPGRGIAWIDISGEMVAGIKTSPFAKAALIADFGGGFGSVTPPEDWSYANLDITLQLLRMPVGDWLLLDAVTHMAGTGSATAESTFADQDGVYARGFQTIFVAPGHKSANLPRRIVGQD